MSAELFYEALADFALALGQPPLDPPPDGDPADPLRARLAHLAAVADAPAAPRLALAVAQVATVRAVTAQVLPAVAALQRSAQLRHLERGDDGAAALAAALDHAGQIVRNGLSLLKELPFGRWPAAQADALLWRLALHGQIRCTRGAEALAADGHALANLASSLQMLDRTVLRHGQSPASRPAAVGAAVLAAYQAPQPLDAVAVGLAALGDCRGLAAWLHACAQEEPHG